MSTILYYSNYCKSSNRVLQLLSKYDMKNQVHFICIDGRINKNGNMYAILPNGQEMLIPKNISAVPSLMILNQQYTVISGVDDIMNFFQKNINHQINTATKNNTVPVSTHADDGYSAFGGFGSGIVSDSFSFLDQDDSELKTTGNGGLRQMHSYATLNDDVTITPEVKKSRNPNGGNSNPINGSSSNSNKSGSRIADGDTSSLLDRYKQERDRDLQIYGPKTAY